MTKETKNLEIELRKVFKNIWRCADSGKWDYLYPTSLLSFDWIDSAINYHKFDFSTLRSGKRSLEPWVKDLKKGDLIFIMGKNTFNGIAIAKSVYDFSGPQMDLGSGSDKPAIEIEYLFKQKKAVSHNLKTHNNPTTFAKIDKYNFGLSSVLNELEQKIPKAYQSLGKYLNHKMKSENLAPIKTLIEYKKQIILQGPPGTGKTKLAKELAADILGLTDVQDLHNHQQFKLIQFHPSYTYEDFVRGIVAKPNSSGEGIIYEAENKTLAEFAEKALTNYELSREENTDAGIEKWIDEKFEEFKSEIEAKLPEDEIQLSGDITLYGVTQNSFLYAKDWQTPAHIRYTDFRKLVKDIFDNKLKLSNQQIPKENSLHAHYRFTYYNALLKLFFEKHDFPKNLEKQEEKSFILIIDEINRSNLSTVLGELIYALEYRGETVESLYEIDGKRELVLPPNLYIIGTMNTADRSVGHIDYAIRRRFAFVPLLPRDLSDDNSIIFDSYLFNEVENLFDKHLSSEFEKADVQIGHSYFIDKSEEGGSMDIRLEYEIKPILLEYVKDGILKENAKDMIENLSIDQS